MKIERSTSFNHYKTYEPGNAHDGSYDTWYSVKDFAMPGNFLKLYLTQAYSISEVKMISSKSELFVGRMVNTEVIVYSSVNIEIKKASCGKITGRKSERCS